MELPPHRDATGTASTPRLRGLRAYPELSARLGATVVALGLIVALLARHDANHNLLAIGLASAALGRGIGLHRPARVLNVAAAITLLAVAHFAGHSGQHAFEQVAIVAAGVVALWAPPAPAPGTETERRKIWALVDMTAGDAIAPFALRKDKSYVFSPDGLAAVAYRVRFGVAVASGDPLGAGGSQAAAVAAFIAVAGSNGWRIGVLGAGEQWTAWWKARGLRSLAIGRDVVINLASYSLAGRSFRNLRQGVQRTRNAGVTTAIYPANDLPPGLFDELKGIVNSSKRNPNRGFAMILDGLLDAEPHPGTLFAVAYDTDHQVVAFHRFSTADSGREISQDLPWRRSDAPNGVDERLANDVIEWGRDNGAKRVSLSFAAFPELYDDDLTTVVQKLGYWGSHQLDRFIRLESLYRYLRKFHALSDRRYVLLRLRDLVPVAAAMLSFEFATRRTSITRSNRWRPSGRVN